MDDASEVDSQNDMKSFISQLNIKDKDEFQKAILCQNLKLKK